MDSIIEIGAGLGNWTEFLARRAGKVYAVEVDAQLHSILERRMEAFPNVETIHADVLKFDFAELFRRHPGERFVIAGNLPYRISSAILFEWINLYRETAGRAFQRAYFMMQREVARRMTAQVGTPEYGRLTVMLAYYGKVRLERAIGRGCFFPVPRVDSAFVSLDFGAGVRERPEEDSRFEQIVRAAFGQRRKQLRNALKGLSIAEKVHEENGESILQKAAVDGSARAGAVSPEAYVRLTRSFLNA